MIPIGSNRKKRLTQCIGGFEHLYLRILGQLHFLAAQEPILKLGNDATGVS